MITLTDIRTRDITTDEIRTMITQFDSIRKFKNVEIKDIDSMIIAKSFAWIIKAFSKIILDGVEDDNATLSLALKLVENNGKKNYVTEVNVNSLDGKTIYNFIWNGKNVAVHDGDGNLVVEGEWRATVRPHFKTVKDVVREERALKMAANPKRRGRKPKSFYEQPVVDKQESDVLDEMDDMLEKNEQSDSSSSDEEL